MFEASDTIFALDALDESHPNVTSPRTPMAPSTHPYASAPPVMPPVTNSTRLSVTTTPSRAQTGRSRASSTLPPPAPPPTALPPPAPAEGQTAPTARPPEAPGRPRGSSLSHRRAGSNTQSSQLTAVDEGSERLNGDHVEISVPEINGASRSRSLVRESKRDSHPLPPLPSPSVDSTPTSRYPTASSSNPQSPVSPAGPHPVSSARSEASNKRDQAPLINATTVMGTISQRRIKTSAPPSMIGVPSSPTESSASIGSLPGMSKLPAATISSLGIVGRSRAVSQPNRRPSLAAANSYPGPPQTASLVPRKPSVPSRLNPHALPHITINTGLLSPPLSKSIVTPLVPPPPIPHGNIPTAPTSPLPPMAPPDPLRKPYHMMNLLRQTMTSKTGGYITRRLHVPQEVWSQGGAKLTNIPEKIRVVEVLSSALEEIQHVSVEYFGAGNVSSGLALGINSIGKKEAEIWASKLEEFSNVCDGLVGNFGKKLGVGEGFATKKSSGVTSWGRRQFDKLTNGKNLDSPATYVQGLAKLFSQVQILDEHTKAVAGQPIAPLYAAFPPDVRAGLELKLRRASEFFAKVVLTFVIRDMALLLDKYVKKCEKWLAE
ncbi:hypothetical protein EIP86_000842 [Pleurotus ostreatoroseus]|nr:hypothetical protein EIP86_000842 [Pleurotus ostreatoroseus]